MSAFFVNTAGGKRVDLPLSTPEIQAHFDNPASLVSRLLAQINDEKIFDFAFKQAKNCVLLDVGANIGLVSLYASDVCRQIVALEPTNQIELLKIICKNCPNVTPMKVALAGHNGTAAFYVNDINTTAGSMSQTYGTPTMVHTITLSTLLKQMNLPKVDIAKIDIEGSELEALTPLELERCKRVVYSYLVEVHNCPNSTWQYKLGKLTQVFMETGYKRIRIRGDSIFACIQ